MKLTLKTRKSRYEIVNANGKIVNTRMTGNFKTASVIWGFYQKHVRKNA